MRLLVLERKRVTSKRNNNRYDLEDLDPSCTNNQWGSNTFEVASPTCIQ